MKIALFFALVIISGANGWTDTKTRSFPSGFLFGAATAAYQVEGAWNEDDKGESIWDRYLHSHPEIIVDGRNGDVAADSYHHVQRDVEMLRELGVDFMRFSISWPRVLPSGYPNKINEKALQYYDSLIEELLKHNIQPMITLYHFDLPQALQDLGGWANPLSITWFEDYAKIIFNRYADRVKYWITINQPNSVCIEGYGDTVMAPAVNSKGVGEYLCVKNVMLAHARAYRLYEKEFKGRFNGSVGISIAVNWIDPLDLNSAEDKRAAEIGRAFTIDFYLHPIWSKAGDFPAVVKDTIAKNSKKQGFLKSRLPALSADEVKILKGSADFLGMNHYTSFLTSPANGEMEAPSFADDAGLSFSQGQKWKRAKSSWLRSAPYGIYKALIHINLQYEYPAIFITEHGWSTDTGLKDTGRVECIRQYLSALLLAMEDGARVLGYTAWSLMDNVEWTAGTSERFGLYEVDFEHENRTRTARLSALVYKHVIETRVIDDTWSPRDLKIRITPKKSVKTEL